jgi:hypothetical protein
MRTTVPQKKSPRNRTCVAGTDLSLAQYAETLATLLHHRSEEVADVIGPLGITSEQWTAAERAWSEVLTCTGHRDDGAISLEFTSLFARARKRLGLATQDAAKLGSVAAAVPAFQGFPPIVPAAPEPSRDAEVPSYLREDKPAPFPDRASPPPPQYPPTMALPIMRPDEVVAPAISPQPLPIAPPPSENEDVNETAEVDVRCFRAALPFSATRTKPSAEAVAVPPAGKRLIRFDPQTGEPLSSPRWADVPVVDGVGVPGSFTGGPLRDEPTGHETAVLPVLPSLPFPVADAPSPERRPPWKPK